MLDVSLCGAGMVLYVARYAFLLTKCSFIRSWMWLYDGLCMNLCVTLSRLGDGWFGDEYIFLWS